MHVKNCLTCSSRNPRSPSKWPSSTVYSLLSDILLHSQNALYGAFSPPNFKVYIHVKLIICSVRKYSTSIYRTGPLVATWCMRMEGKNAYFKSAAQCSNFKNVAYSVARRHQRLLCGYLQSKNFFDKELELGPGKYTCTCNIVVSFTCIYIHASTGQLYISLDYTSGSVQM